VHAGITLSINCNAVADSIAGAAQKHDAYSSQTVGVQLGSTHRSVSSVRLLHCRGRVPVRFILERLLRSGTSVPDQKGDTSSDSRPHVPIYQWNDGIFCTQTASTRTKRQRPAGLQHRSTHPHMSHVPQRAAVGGRQKGGQHAQQNGNPFSRGLVTVAASAHGQTSTSYTYLTMIKPL
jgi:hypothetical protein